MLWTWPKQGGCSYKGQWHFRKEQMVRNVNVKKPWRWWKAPMESDGEWEAHGSWQVKAELLLDFSLVTDVSGSSSGIKKKIIKKSQTPPQERWEVWAGWVCHRNKGNVCTLWKGSRWRAWQEMWKGSLIWATVWLLSTCMRLNRFLFWYKGSPKWLINLVGGFLAKAERSQELLPAQGRSGLLQP